MKALALSVLAMAWAALAEPGPAPSSRTTLLAAHRGGAALWPENSLLAFRNAVALGVDYLELDVHLSRDGEVMVIHDPTLERTTTGQGAVRDHTRAELRGLALRDGRGDVTAERIPTLDEVAALAAASGRGLLLEIKPGPGKVAYPGIEERVLGILDRHAMTASTVVMAFERETWTRVRALRPDVQAGALYSARALEPGPGVARAFTDARATGVAFVGLAYALVGADAVAAARRAGVRLGAWTVNDADAMRRLIDRGIDVLITDRPDAAKAILSERRSP